MTLDQRGSLNLAICGNIRGSSSTDRGNNLEVRTIRREGRSRKRSEPSETLRRSPRASGEDKVRPSRRREEVTRNRGPPESLVNQVTRSNSSERNTLSLNWRLA